MQSKVKSLLPRLIRNSELWTILLLALTSWKSSAALLRYVSEPDIWDEPAIYIRQGLEIAKAGDLAGFFAIEGPLYSVWYAFLSLFESDPFHLYYLNGRTLCFLLPLAVYLVCRSLRLGQLASLLATASLLLFPPLLTINRWNNHFLLLILFVGFASIVRIQDRVKFAASFVVLNVVAGFVRPEMQVGVLISVAYLLFAVARDFRWKEKSLYVPIGIALAVFAFFAKKFWLRDLQIFNKGSYVFFDYTMRRYPEWNHLTWSEIISRLYGPDVRSPIQALIANPVEMFKHMTFYSSMGFSTLLSMIRSYGYLFETLFGLSLLIALGSLGGLCFVYRKSPFVTRLLGKTTAPSKRFIFLGAILVLPVVAVISLYGSVPRYLFACVVFLILLLCTLIRREGKPVALILTGVICLLCFVAPADYAANTFAQQFYGADNGTNYGQQSARATVLAFRALRLREPRMTLTVNFPGQIFIDGKYYVSTCWDPTNPCYTLDEAKRSDLRELLDGLRVNEVFLDFDFRKLLEGRLKNPGLRLEFAHFFENPAAYDFTRVRIPCTKDAIFVRKASLHPELSPDSLEAQINQVVLKDVHCPTS